MKIVKFSVFGLAIGLLLGAASQYKVGPAVIRPASAPIQPSSAVQLPPTGQDILRQTEKTLITKWEYSPKRAKALVEEHRELIAEGYGRGDPDFISDLIAASDSSPKHYNAATNRMVTTPKRTPAEQKAYEYDLERRTRAGDPKEYDVNCEPGQLPPTGLPEAAKAKLGALLGDSTEAEEDGADQQKKLPPAGDEKKYPPKPPKGDTCDCNCGSPNCKCAGNVPVQGQTGSCATGSCGTTTTVGDDSGDGEGRGKGRIRAFIKKIFHRGGGGGRRGGC